MENARSKIHFDVTSKMKEGAIKIAKEYNVTLSEFMRTLIADVLDNDEEEVVGFRNYSMRKTKRGADDGSDGHK